MSEMIERVAKALAIADGMHPDAVCDGDESAPIWVLYLDDAKAAISAMRDVTDGMFDAGHKVDIMALRNVSSIYDAMIAEALK